MSSNPYIIEIQWFATRHLSGIDFGVTLAVVQSLAFIIAGLISIAKLAGGSQSAALGLLGFTLSVLAPTPKAGTTFIDLIAAVPVLAGYALLLVRGRLFSPLASAALADVLLGGDCS